MIAPLLANQIKKEQLQVLLMYSSFLKAEIWLTGSTAESVLRLWVWMARGLILKEKSPIWKTGRSLPLKALMRAWEFLPWFPKQERAIRPCCASVTVRRKHCGYPLRLNRATVLQSISPEEIVYW